MSLHKITPTHHMLFLFFYFELWWPMNYPLLFPSPSYRGGFGSVWKKNIFLGIYSINLIFFSFLNKTFLKNPKNPGFLQKNPSPGPHFGEKPMKNPTGPGFLKNPPGFSNYPKIGSKFFFLGKIFKILIRGLANKKGGSKIF